LTADEIHLSIVADRRTAEVLSLEVGRLAKSLGLEVGQIRVELAGEAVQEEQTRESS
jgi:hypothetical protein